MGQNFYEIKRIYFSKDSVEVTMPITDYQVSNDYEQITFNMPDKLKEGGYIFVDCYTDEASIEFVPTGPKPAITGISSTMPMPGTEVTIVGKNFINVSNVNINGEFDIPKEDLEVSEAMNAITFTMPEAPEKDSIRGNTSFSTSTKEAAVVGAITPIHGQLTEQPIRLLRTETIPV